MKDLINVRLLREAYTRLANVSPTDNTAEQLTGCIDAAFDAIADAFKAHGFQWANDDHAEEMVGAITGYLLDSNPSFRAAIPPKP